jgi:PAS domain S-box-containing protein
MMSKKTPHRESANLRRRAEERVATHGKTTASRSVTDARRLIHELEVHKVELILQNEELRDARAELEANYNELYDFAPVGYFTLKRNGDIENANLTGAIMLGQPRAQLLGQRFAAFVRPEALRDFNDFWRRAIGGTDKEGCMVTLMKGGTTHIIAYVEATRAGPHSNRRLVVVDMTSLGLLQDISERERVRANAGRAGLKGPAVTRTRRNAAKPDKLGTTIERKTPNAGRR